MISKWYDYGSMIKMSSLAEDYVLVVSLRKVDGYERTYEVAFYVVQGLTTDQAMELFKVNPQILESRTVAGVMDTKVSIQVFFRLRKLIDEIAIKFNVKTLYWRVSKESPKLMRLYDLYFRYYYRKKGLSKSVKRDASLPTAVKYIINFN